MKILIIGDLHIMPSNAITFPIFVEECVKIVKSKTPDMIVILGDTLDSHEKINMVSLNRAIDFFNILLSSFKGELYILIGNHDRENNNVYLTEMSPFKSLKNWQRTHIIDKVEHLVFLRDPKDKKSKRNIYFVPYVPPSKFNQTLSDYIIKNKLDNTSQSNLIFAHQEFSGAQMGAITSSCEEYDGKIVVISGHIHEHQIISTKEKDEEGNDEEVVKVVYIGTPLNLSYGSSTTRYLGFLDTNYWKDEIIKNEIDLNGRYILQMIPLKVPQMETLLFDYNEFMGYELLNIVDSLDKIKIKISCKRDEREKKDFKTKVHEAEEKGYKIIVIMERDSEINRTKNIYQLNFEQNLYKYIEKEDENIINEIQDILKRC